MKSWFVKLMGLWFFLVISTVQAADVTIESAQDFTLGDRKYARLIYITANGGDNFKGSLDAVMVRAQDANKWTIALRGGDAARRSFFCTKLEQQPYNTLLSQFRSVNLLGDSDNWAMMGNYTESGLREKLEGESYVVNIIPPITQQAANALDFGNRASSLLRGCNPQFEWGQLQKWDELQAYLSSNPPAEVLQGTSAGGITRSQEDANPPTPENRQSEQKVAIPEQRNIAQGNQLGAPAQPLPVPQSPNDNPPAEPGKSGVFSNIVNSIITTIKDKWPLILYIFILLVIIIIVFYSLYVVVIEPWLQNKKDSKHPQRRSGTASEIESKGGHDYRSDPSNLQENQPSKDDSDAKEGVGRDDDHGPKGSDADSEKPESRDLSLTQKINVLKNATDVLHFYSDRAKNLGQVILDCFGNGDFADFLLTIRKAFKESKELDIQLANEIGINKDELESRLNIILNDAETLRKAAEERQKSQRERSHEEETQININKFSRRFVEGLPNLNQVAHCIKDTLTRSKDTINLFSHQIQEYTKNIAEYTTNIAQLEAANSSLKIRNQSLDANLERLNSELTSVRKHLMLRDGFIVGDEGKENIQRAWEIYRDDKDSTDDSLELCRRFKSLRKFLQTYQPSELADYYSACGINNIRVWLQDKKSQHQIFWGNGREYLLESLQGNWRDYWWEIFRTVLLLETYWPDADSKLCDELRCTQKVIRDILGKYGIEVHTLGLLDQAKINEKIKGDTRTPLNSNLKNNPRFADEVRPRAERDYTYCDVSSWGYDINGRLMEKSHLIVKARGEGW